MSDSNSDDVVANVQAEAVDILEVQIKHGLSELNRPTSGLLLSALSAGLDIGFGPLLMGIILTAADPALGSLPKQLLLGVVYGVGFILVVLGRSELFTEHTTLAVLPVLSRDASVLRLGRLWSLIYVGNLAGALVFAAFAVAIGPAVGIIEAKAFTELATTYTELSPGVLVGAGVLAGWLMGLLSWLVAAADSTIARLSIVWIITAAIGVAHLPHCIAGSVEVFGGLLVSPEVGYVDFLRFLVFSTIGNIIGGTVFVALLKYGHVARSGPSAEAIRQD